MGKDSPFEAPAYTREWARMQHDMFISLMDAGFTEGQAIQYIVWYFAILTIHNLDMDEDK